MNVEYSEQHTWEGEPVRLCEFWTRGYCNDVAGWVERDGVLHAVSACPACEHRMLESEARARSMRHQRFGEMIRYQYGVCY